MIFLMKKISFFIFVIVMTVMTIAWGFVAFILLVIYVHNPSPSSALLVLLPIIATIGFPWWSYIVYKKNAGKAWFVIALSEILWIMHFGFIFWFLSHVFIE